MCEILWKTAVYTHIAHSRPQTAPWPTWRANKTEECHQMEHCHDFVSNCAAKKPDENIKAENKIGRLHKADGACN